MLKTQSRLGPYEIIAPLGAGGMGEVYRARDERLHRDVAIKVLPAAFAADPDRLHRFELEARATATLSHPNVLAVFDVGTHEGCPFLVEELLEGDSLRTRLNAGALPTREAVGIAAAIARGLAAAHDKGIVHRDLKPENVFITRDDVVKILDFGLARLTPAQTPGPELTDLLTEPPATAVGVVLGTAGYMAPEQARGQPADARADVFALGCVLYELLSGVRPFRGDTVTDTVAAILKEAPPALPASVPPALQRLVARCLEKRPEARYQSSRDLAHDLEAMLTDPGHVPSLAAESPGKARRLAAWAVAGVAVAVVAGVLVLTLRPARPGTTATKPKRIVVLPFDNLGAPEDAYFAAGMADEITSRLANVEGLGVISRTSAAEYARGGKSIAQIGSELSVDYVLEGSVRWERGPDRESRVRITPELIRVADDTHVWSDRYDRVLADVFAIQSEVAESTVKAMGVALLPREQTALKEVSTNDLEAYDLYLRGREIAGRSDNRKDIEGAITMFRAAIDRDPRFAPALAGLARNCLRMSFIHFDRSQDWLAEAKDAARRAVDLRPDLSETHGAIGWYYYQGLADYPRALEEFSAARTIQPSNSDVLFGIGSVLRRQGRWVEATEAMGKAVEIDPGNPTLLVNFAASCVLARRYSDADRAFESAIALNPRFGGPYGQMAWLQVLWRGDQDRARAIADRTAKVADLSDDQGLLATGQLSVLRCRRDYPAALRQLEREKRPALVNQLEYSPIPLLRGEVQLLAGQTELGRRFFEAARTELEQKTREAPGDARLHSALGIAYAGLGRRDDAEREAGLGCDLMPPSKDAWLALHRRADLALVCTMVGDRDRAIGQLTDLLAESGELTPDVLRLDPRWDPLRSDPRFQALLTAVGAAP